MRSLPPLRLAALIACALAGAPAVGAFAGSPTTAGAARSDDALPERARAFLDAHCVSCHGPEAQQGDLRLDGKHAPAPGGDEDVLDWEYLHERVAFDERPEDLADLPPRRDRSEVHSISIDEWGEGEGPGDAGDGDAGGDGDGTGGGDPERWGTPGGRIS